jgi:hypothetical protein
MGKTKKFFDNNIDLSGARASVQTKVPLVESTWNRIVKAFNRLGTYKGDVILILLGVFLWRNLEWILKIIDHEAVSPRADYLTNFAYAAVGIILAHFITKIVFRSGWRTLEDLLEMDFKKEVSKLTGWQKIKLAVSVFLTYLVSFVLLTMTM